MQSICIGEKVGGDVLKCCDILKYWKTAIPLWFLKHLNYDPFDRRYNFKNHNNYQNYKSYVYFPCFWSQILIGHLINILKHVIC